MPIQTIPMKATVGRVGSVLVLFALIAGCGTSKPKPVDLPSNPALIGVRPVWNARVGRVNYPLQVRVVQGSVAVGDSGGEVVAFDAQTGREQWRNKIGAELSAGVGGADGRWSVVTRSNDLIALDASKINWRAPQTVPSYTAPLVAGGRVFLLAADRSVSAFDGASGRRLWLQQRPSEPLTLRQAGLLMPVGNTLVAGLSGRMVGMDPSSGNARWEVALASPRGTNDVERLVDLVDHVSRVDNVICARAFQAAVGCVDAGRGVLQWTRQANGFEGVGGDEQRVYGTEGDGTVQAWRRSDGEPAWSNSLFKYRRLSAPLALGRAIAIGDDSGNVHFLSSEDGKLLARVPTDGSPIAAGPVLLDGSTFVVVTRNGGVFVWRTE